MDPLKRIGESFLHEIAESQIIWISKSRYGIEHEVYDSLLHSIWGAGNYQKEKKDCHRLRSGIHFESRHPNLAKVGCNTCREYWFDPLLVDISPSDAWTVKIHGKPAKKPSGTEPLCVQCPGSCPAGHYKESNRLSGKYLLAYHHYLECKATRNFPDDPIVRRNAKVIEKALS